MLGGELAVLQAPMFDGLSLDPFAQFDDCRSPAEVGVGRRHVGQALVVSLVVGFHAELSRLWSEPLGLDHGTQKN